MKSYALCLTLLLLALPLAGCLGGDDGDDPPAGGTTPATSTPAASTPATSTPSGTAVNEDFESATLGALPARWTVVAGNWSVRANASAPSGGKVLYSDRTDLGETTILADAAGEWADLDASVSFNVLGGEKGQAGGIVFRYEDAKNYYVVRYNHAEGQWNLFRTIDGKREKFEATEEAASFQGDLDKWIPLRLEARGGHVTVHSGSLKVIDYTETYANAPKSGKVGLWTRYDSQTQFDGFSVAAV